MARAARLSAPDAGPGALRGAPVGLPSQIQVVTPFNQPGGLVPTDGTDAG
jgi:hypothetical protein